MAFVLLKSFSKINWPLELTGVLTQFLQSNVHNVSLCAFSSFLYIALPCSTTCYIPSPISTASHPQRTQHKACAVHPFSITRTARDHSGATISTGHPLRLSNFIPLTHHRNRFLIPWLHTTSFYTSLCQSTLPPPCCPSPHLSARAVSHILL